MLNHYIRHLIISIHLKPEVRIITLEINQYYEQLNMNG